MQQRTGGVYHLTVLNRICDGIPRQSVPKRRVLLLCLLGTAFSLIPGRPAVAQDEPIRVPDTKETEEAKAKPDEPFISFSPGISVEQTRLGISGRNKDDAELAVDKPQFNWFLNVKSSDHQLFEWFGMHIASETASFHLQRQIPFGATFRVKDYGTEARGRYYYIAPVFYVGQKDPDGFRIGFGAGLGTMSVRGTAEYRNDFADLLWLSAMRLPRDQLQLFGAVYNTSGRTDVATDPYLVYVMSTLGEPGGLRRLTEYELLNGTLTRIERLNWLLLGAAAMASGPAGYDALERLTLLAARRGSYRIKGRLLTTISGYYETPTLSGFRFRYAYALIWAPDAKYTFQFMKLSLYAYYPVAF